MGNHGKKRKAERNRTSKEKQWEDYRRFREQFVEEEAKKSAPKEPKKRGR